MIILVDYTCDTHVTVMVYKDNQLVKEYRTNAFVTLGMQDNLKRRGWVNELVTNDNEVYAILTRT